MSRNMNCRMARVSILDSPLARELMAEVGPTLKRLIGRNWKNKQGFPRYAHEKSLGFFKKRFAEVVWALAPNSQAEHWLTSDKLGICAQLLELKRGKLVMGFSVEHVATSTRVLVNAGETAFTSTSSFSQMVLDEAGVT